MVLEHASMHGFHRPVDQPQWPPQTHQSEPSSSSKATQPLQPRYPPKQMPVEKQHGPIPPTGPPPKKHETSSWNVTSKAGVKVPEPPPKPRVPPKPWWPPPPPAPAPAAQMTTANTTSKQPQTPPKEAAKAGPCGQRAKQLIPKAQASLHAYHVMHSCMHSTPHSCSMHVCKQ